ncbi:MAG: gamma carbonic anhydrase family protein [Planctomycetes bacterium]|nr:gamma carbonic anhydrase family protein [Planctomycetota bacterium]
MNAQFRRIADWYHAANAVLVGEIEVGAGSSIWYGAVLRGDDAPIRIGRRVNLQDLTVVHPDPGIPIVIEDDVTVGHRAVLHCRRVGTGSLIGMGAVLMKGVEVGAGSLVAGGAVLGPGTIVPPGSLVRGVPGKVARAVTSEERADIARSVEKYAATAREYFASYGGDR